VAKNRHLILILGAASLFIHCTFQGQLPNVFLMNRAALEEARISVRSGQHNSSPCVKELFKNAEKALTANVVSVMMKEQTPPSGDKHDYMSLAPYWWPDPTKPGGLPYIRRDGERNPEYKTYGDHERIGAMIKNVEALALAFGVSGKERFAGRAIVQLKVWFLDPATKMNPNLNYGQAIKGVNQGRGIGIIETYGFRYLVDAMILLQRSKAWTPEIDRGIKAWFEEYLRWLQESPNGKDEAGWKNNHGSAYDVQVSCIALFLDKKDIAKQVLSQVGTKRIALQIEPDGSQPLELERTKSWGYSNMNLAALLELARLGERVGVDIWNFQTSDGRTIRKAIGYLLPYALGNKKWPWTQIVPFQPEGIYYALRIAANKYSDMSYLFAAQSIVNDEVRSSRLLFYLPPLPVE
jgi:hypothetical protein